MLATSAASDSTSELNCEVPEAAMRLIFVRRITAKRIAGTTIALNRSVSATTKSSDQISICCRRTSAMASSSHPCQPTSDA